ncbi:hypothetical protein [Arcticibacter tournemirensis]
MKKIILFIALLCGTASLALAQPGQQRTTPEERATRNVEMLEKRLSLTADQKAKIHTIALEQVKAMDSLRTEARNAGTDRQAMWSKMQLLQQEHDKKITALLSDDQKKQYQQVIEDRQKRMRGGQGRPGTEKPAGNQN